MHGMENIKFVIVICYCSSNICDLYSKSVWIGRGVTGHRQKKHVNDVTHNLRLARTRTHMGVIMYHIQHS
jgi:hypothetical protein